MAGIVVFYIVTKGLHPFGAEPDRQRNLIDGQPVYLNKLIDPSARDLISWMLGHDPKERPSAVQALKHPYLQSAEQQFKMLGEVGNQREVKSDDKDSNVVRELNSKDATDWRTRISPDVLKYLSTNPLTGKLFNYDSSWAQCLRLIRNVSQHWYDLRPLPQPVEFYLVGDPQVYFLTLFPNLPTDVHRIVRTSDWKERPDLMKYFM